MSVPLTDIPKLLDFCKGIFLHVIHVRSWSLPKQFVIFKPLSYCFEETTGFDVQASFASRPEPRLIS